MLDLRLLDSYCPETQEEQQDQQEEEEVLLQTSSLSPDDLDTSLT